MPNSVYPPKSNTLRERLHAHPMENAVAAFVLCVGWLFLLAPFLADPPSPSMANLPDVLIAGIGLFLFGGGALVLIGMHHSWPLVSKGWFVEKLGWLATIAGLAGYSVAQVAYGISGPIGWMLLVFIMSGGVFRFRALTLLRLRTEQATEEVRRKFEDPKGRDTRGD